VVVVVRVVVRGRMRWRKVVVGVKASVVRADAVNNKLISNLIFISLVIDKRRRRSGVVEVRACDMVSDSRDRI